MDVKEVLDGQGLTARLEKHETECALRYGRIEERLEDQKDSLRRLDLKIWRIAFLIITTPFINKLVG